RAAVAASLLAPEGRGYEVAARPERLLLPAPPGSAAPVPTPRVFSEVSSALSEMPAQASVEWSGGTRGIGLLTLDTMTWQRGGPRGASTRSFYGLALPLLKRGVPVQVVPA